MADQFGPEVAARYDDSSDVEFDLTEIEKTVSFLANQAGQGPALEFGVGTGRIAIPLSGTGLAVTGVDLSPAMIGRLESKPGSEQIITEIGDFATTRVEGQFSLVYLVFNTIMNLVTQDAQFACFENAATHLRAGGRFVVEVVVPPLRLLPPGQKHVVFAADDGKWGVDEIDVATQSLISHHLTEGDQLVRNSVPMRYVWPSELDLMARMAGMRLEARYADWDRSPFTSDSPKHVSVFQKV